jgi:hypothetical protein
MTYRAPFSVAILSAIEVTLIEGLDGGGKGPMYVPGRAFLTSGGHGRDPFFHQPRPLLDVKL